MFNDPHMIELEGYIIDINAIDFIDGTGERPELFLNCGRSLVLYETDIDALRWELRELGHLA